MKYGFVDVLVKFLGIDPEHQRYDNDENIEIRERSNVNNILSPSSQLFFKPVRMYLIVQ